jgi:preprotein translocase subunit SecD
MHRNLRVMFVAIVILTVVAIAIVVPFPNKLNLPVLSHAKIGLGTDLAGGAELRYKVLFGPEFPGDQQEATRLACEVIRRRLEAQLLKEPKITSHGDDQIVIQIAGIDSEELRHSKELIATSGKLALHAAAPMNLQARYDRDLRVPEGYAVVRDAAGRPLLIEERPVLDGRHVIHAAPEQTLAPGGPRWVTVFELDAEGAKRFDEAAEKLYHQQPQGRIAILLDGKVKSVAVVRSPSFQGRGQISGSSD